MSTKILVVDDKQIMRDSVAATLQRAGFAPVAAADGEQALALAQKHQPAAVVTDLKMPKLDGLGLLERLKQADANLPVVLMTAYGSVEDAVEAMKFGAFDFVQKPFDGDHLVSTIRRAVEVREALKNSATKSKSHGSNGSVAMSQTVPAPTLLGKSEPMKGVARQIQQIAHSTGTVLIQGESGTGKEVVARTIHAHSPRAAGLMLCLNCAALSSSLLESELFGHEKGAFTGADQLRKGRFELADGGTLLLDEISEISPQLQAKLLRILQEGQFERVGSSMTMQVDVRVIATTNRDLTQSVADGTFRQDLYYRLNVLPVVLPPLRERADDVPLLAEHFLSQVAHREGREPKRFDAEATEMMKAYPWPGNVRELQNICERASVLSKTHTIAASVIRPWLVHSPQPWTAPAACGLAQPTHVPAQPAHSAPLGSPPLQVVTPPAPAMTSTQVKPLDQIEREQIIVALDRFGGNRTKTAEALGIGVRTLGLKLKKWKEENLVAQSV